jgi:hypothetical protein
VRPKSHGWGSGPPRSSDLTFLDFHFWGHVKQIMYSVRILNIQHLKQPIMEAAPSVTAYVPGRVWQEMEYRLDLLILIRSINMQLYLFSFLFLHYMFRLHAVIFSSLRGEDCIEQENHLKMAA